MDHLQAFQNKRILDNKISSSEALNSLQWIPLAEQRFAHQCSAVQDAIKGEIPEHLETFKITLRDLRGHNTRNSYLPRIPNPKTECGKRTTYYYIFINFFMLVITVISSFYIVILRQFSFIHKKNVHRVYILIIHILEPVNSLFFF